MLVSAMEFASRADEFRLTVKREQGDPVVLVEFGYNQLSQNLGLTVRPVAAGKTEPGVIRGCFRRMFSFCS
jgi:hypothetical protein